MVKPLTFLCKKKDLSMLANGRITLNIRTGRLNLTSLDIDVNMRSTLVRIINSQICYITRSPFLSLFNF